MLKKDYDKLKKQLKKDAEVAKQCEGADVQHFSIDFEQSKQALEVDPLVVGLCNLKE